MYGDAPRSGNSSTPPRTTPHRAADATSSTEMAGSQFGGLLALPLVVLLFLLGPGKLVAQQTPPSNQGWSQDDDYNGQYAPNQQPDYGQQDDVRPSYPDSGDAYQQQGYGRAPLNTPQLEQLVAPIALYPDTLVAQVLAASTYPGQIADADRWRQMQGDASPDQIAAGADAQNWDPSVKALVAFPQVLAQLDRNQQWTTDLGNAYYNQPQDMLQAVQVMRRRAQAAGTLESTPQQAVDYDRGYIQLTPVNPQVVYVPTYNPWTVYGEQVSPYPDYSLLGGVESFLGSSPITYGLGVAISAFSHSPWGWLAWGLNWFAQSVLFNQSNYYSHSNSVADWGFRHDGLHAYAGRGTFAGHSYNRTADGFHRFGGGYDGNRGHGFSRQMDRYGQNWRGKSNNGFQNFRGGYRRDSAPGPRLYAVTKQQAAVRPQWLRIQLEPWDGRRLPQLCAPILRPFDAGHRAQVFSAANSGDGLRELSRATTLRTPPENHRTRVASICLVAGTRPRLLEATARVASTWEAADMRRRASTVAGKISAGGTRTAEEVTPAVTAASITAESSRPRLPVATKRR